MSNAQFPHKMYSQKQLGGSCAVKIHIVKKGDTLYELSDKYDIDLKTLISKNTHIDNPDQLQVGMKVKVPVGPTAIETVAKQPVEVQSVPKQNVPVPNALTPIAAIGTDAPHDPIGAHTDKGVLPPKADAPTKVLNTPLTVAPNVPGTVDAPMDVTPPVETKHPFAQFNTPAAEVGSFYDMPAIPVAQHAWDAQMMHHQIPSFPAMPYSAATQNTSCSCHDQPFAFMPPNMQSPMQQAFSPYPAQPALQPFAQLPAQPAFHPYMQQLFTGSPYIDVMQGYTQPGYPYPATPTTHTNAKSPDTPTLDPMELINSYISAHADDGVRTQAAAADRGTDNEANVNIKQAQEPQKKLNIKATNKKTKKSKTERLKAVIHGKRSKAIKRTKVNFPWINV
jgi:hypothetical protein